MQFSNIERYQIINDHHEAFNPATMNTTGS